MQSTLFSAHLRTRFFHSFGFSRNMTAASMFAGESAFGAESSEITLMRICSTPKIGLQRSSALSCSLKASSPGG